MTKLKCAIAEAPIHSILFLHILSKCQLLTKIQRCNCLCTLTLVNHSCVKELLVLPKRVECVTALAEILYSENKSVTVLI